MTKFKMEIREHRHYNTIYEIRGNYIYEDDTRKWLLTEELIKDLTKIKYEHEIYSGERTEAICNLLNYDKKYADEYITLKVSKKSRQRMYDIKTKDEDIEKLLLTLYPPDTEERRTLIKESDHNVEECMKFLDTKYIEEQRIIEEKEKEIRKQKYAEKKLKLALKKQQK